MESYFVFVLVQTPLDYSYFLLVLVHSETLVLRTRTYLLVVRVRMHSTVRKLEQMFKRECFSQFVLSWYKFFFEFPIKNILDIQLLEKLRFYQIRKKLYHKNQEKI